MCIRDRGLATGFWTKAELDDKWSLDQRFEPEMDVEQSKKLYHAWNVAVKRTMNWEREVNDLG